MTPTKIMVGVIISVLLLSAAYSVFNVQNIKGSSTIPSITATQLPDDVANNGGRDKEKIEPVQNSNFKANAVQQGDNDVARFVIDCLKMNAEIVGIESALDQTSSQMLPVFSVKNEKDLDDLSKKLASIRSKKEQCNNIDHNQFLETSGKILRESATNGDIDSQLCVIEQKLLSARTKGLSDDEKNNRETYLTNYRDDAYNRGDLRIVQLDAENALTVGHGPIGSHMTAFPIDKATYYRSLLLLRKAAVGSYAEELDNSIIQFKKSINSQDESTSFSDKELQEQEHNAELIFDKNFKNSAKLQSPPIPCGS